MLTRVRMVCSPRVLRRAGLAAALVGTLLVALNQGDLWLAGQVSGRVLVKSLVTPLIPFSVTLLGAWLNSRAVTRAEELRPGWAAIRRSVVLALLVGSMIILVNQGDVLLAGALTPRVLVKMLLTPCVPFCVSLYGAYSVYWNALAVQHAARQATDAQGGPDGIGPC
ncbi:MAG: nitrate/nitrite transporter NrtS [Candidatus Tectimicrobiota bacterium]